MSRWIVGCEYSGRTREALRAKGHDVISCDLLPSEDGSSHHIVGDLFDVIKSEGPFDGGIFHPSCTYLANSGVRWIYENPDREVDGFDRPVNGARVEQLIEAADFFAKIMALDIPKIAVENPIMHKHARFYIQLGMPGVKFEQHFVQPWWYGDPFFKATGFTLKNLPALQKPTTALVPPKKGTDEHKAWSAVHLASPGVDRWKERSRTFLGIALEMARVWG